MIPLLTPLSPHTQMSTHAKITNMELHKHNKIYTHLSSPFEIFNLLSNGMHTFLNVYVPQTWSFNDYNISSQKYVQQQMRETLPDLPRYLTSNELTILPRVINKLLQVNELNWFFETLVKNLDFHFEALPFWITPYWPDGTPIINSYSVYTRKNRLYYVTENNLYRIKKKRTERAATCVRDKFEYYLLSNIAKTIRNEFIKLWCTVPHKKGMQVKTIAKQLFSIIPDIDKPSIDNQQLFISTFCSICDNIKQEDKDAKIQRAIEQKKQIQQDSYSQVLSLERYNEVMQNTFANKLNEEQERLDILKQKYDKQQNALLLRQQRNEAELNKIADKIENAKNIRSATLLSGVCKSLNMFYKTTPNLKITENPFTNISNNTFIITECMRKSLQ